MECRVQISECRTNGVGPDGWTTIGKGEEARGKRVACNDNRATCSDLYRLETSAESRIALISAL